VDRGHDGPASTFIVDSFGHGWTVATHVGDADH
jgi:hypothetical protein